MLPIAPGQSIQEAIPSRRGFSLACRLASSTLLSYRYAPSGTPPGRSGSSLTVCPSKAVTATKLAWLVGQSRLARCSRWCSYPTLCGTDTPATLAAAADGTASQQNRSYRCRVLAHGSVTASVPSPGDGPAGVATIGPPGASRCA